MRSTDPFWFRYKEPEKYGQGQQFGIMAQDLAKTPVGRTAVERMPNGKLAIDTPKLTTINTAAMAEQQKHIDEQDDELARLNAQLDKLLAQSRGGREVSVGRR